MEKQKVLLSLIVTLLLLFIGGIISVNKATERVEAHNTEVTTEYEQQIRYSETEAQLETVLEPTETEETSETEEGHQTLIGSLDFGDDDAERLMRIAMAEAESEGVEGKALVMLVVLNRVWTEEFPNTIEEVISQKNQFSTYSNRYQTCEPDEECYEALALVMSGWDESQGALYFESCQNSDNWHSQNLTFLFEYGGHRFYE